VCDFLIDCYRRSGKKLFHNLFGFKFFILLGFKDNIHVEVDRNFGLELTWVVIP
jgi:hypothetical protein